MSRKTWQKSKFVLKMEALIQKTSTLHEGTLWQPRECSINIVQKNEPMLSFSMCIFLLDHLSFTCLFWHVVSLPRGFDDLWLTIYTLVKALKTCVLLIELVDWGPAVFI